MTVTDRQVSTVAEGRKQPDHPVAGRRFDLLATALAAWVILGLFVDVNAHNHGQVDDTFFTPWHFLLYSGVLANGLLLVIAQYRNVGRGFAWSRALPQGYFLSLIGVLMFAFGGAFDFAWHEAFGFEADIEALLSPSHLLLASGAALFMTGPLRALWGRSAVQSGWRDLFPAIVSALIMLSLLTVFTQYAHAMTQPTLFTGHRPSNPFLREVAMIATVLIPSLLLSGALLLPLRRWRLPPGAVTVILFVNGALMFFLRIGHIGDHWPILLAPLVAGIVGDGLLMALRSSPQRVSVLRLFAFLVPFSYFLAYFVILMLTDGIWWRIHMWLGVTFMSGITGLGLSYLVWPPAVPGEPTESL